MASISMNKNDPNTAAIELVAKHLGRELCPQMVFVGGAVAGLLITDAAMPAIRNTEDVDIVCEVMALTDYYALESQLMKQGFKQDVSPSAPICRWTIGSIKVDIMPSLEKILGFSNRWYPLALKSATRFTLPSSAIIRLIAAPAFLGTKLEAFYGRGNGDFLFSHDIGDMIAVIDGRETLLAECQESAADLRAYLSTHFSQLLKNNAFLQALPGHLPPDSASQQRLPYILQVLNKISLLGIT